MGLIGGQERIAHFEQVCRGHKIPLTVQRRAVFEALLDKETHPTADAVYDEIRSRVPGISRTTVYRILDTFVRLGLIMKICHPGSAARFDPKVHQHHHLVCTQCETILDLEAENLNRITWPDTRASGFEIKDYHIHFRGLCADCRGKADAAPTTRSKAKRHGKAKSAAQRKRRPDRKRKEIKP